MSKEVNEEEPGPIGDERFELALKVLEGMPEEVLEAGPEATRAYLAERRVALEGLDMSERSGYSRSPLLADWGCVAAITGFVATNLNPAARAFKLARLIKKIGYRRFANIVKEAKRGNKRELENALKAAGFSWEEFMGITFIRDEC